MVVGYFEISLAPATLGGWSTAVMAGNIFVNLDPLVFFIVNEHVRPISSVDGDLNHDGVLPCPIFIK